MIPQRNISRLSNRLAREGGRRIREEVLERDYCLAWFLADLAESDLNTLLAFKGGTALKRCYFGDYRFSEDLDFSLLTPTPLAEILRGLEKVYVTVRESSGILFGLDREDRQKHANTYTFYLKYTGPLPAGNDVKVDITLRERLVYPLQKKAILRGYEEFEDIHRTGGSKSIRWMKSWRKKRLHWRTERETNREISTTCGI
jgi:predicted nucleotidyltransferase component of viral defense system